MKNLLILVIVDLLLLSCAHTDSIQTQPIDVSIFQELDNIVTIDRWSINNKTKAGIFEKIYFRHYKNPNFNDVLFEYLNNHDKYYWIGIYLDEPYYTEIDNYELSLQVLLKGLKLIKEENEKVRFLWIIGKKYYYGNEKKQSLEYLVKAHKLSKKYPGSTPTWKSKEEYNEIMSFIKRNTE